MDFCEKWADGLIISRFQQPNLTQRYILNLIPLSPYHQYHDTTHITILITILGLNHIFTTYHILPHPSTSTQSLSTTFSPSFTRPPFIVGLHLSYGFISDLPIRFVSNSHLILFDRFTPNINNILNPSAIIRNRLSIVSTSFPSIIISHLPCAYSPFPRLHSSTSLISSHFNSV